MSVESLETELEDLIDYIIQMDRYINYLETVLESKGLLAENDNFIQETPEYEDFE